MTTTDLLATAEDLLCMPSDGFRYELVRGEVRKMAAAGHRHGRVAINLTVPLAAHVRARGLGAVYAAETGFKLAADPDTVRAADAAFVRRDRVEEVGDSEGFWPGAPDLAVEVVSPSDRYTEVQEKVLEWLEAGTRIVIVIDSEDKTVTVYRSRAEVRVLGVDDMLEGGDVVLGWSMPVRELFV